jgi:O-antigen ligase
MFSPLPGTSLESSLYAISLLGFALFLARMDDAMQQRCLRFILMGFIVNMAAGAIQLSFDRRAAVAGMLPFEITAGLFANENHFCAQIYAMIPLIAWFYLGRVRRIWAYVLFVGLIVALLFATGSRAGMAIAAGLGVLCLAWFLSPRPEFAGKALLVAACVPVLAASLWAAQPEALRQDQRTTFFSTTATAIGDHWLAGSGLGTFADIYAGYEPADDIMRTHANHAHNDYLEIVLETGIAGAALIFLFCAIIAANGGRSQLAQAAFLSVMALMLHSAVDYPLRTYGVAVPFMWMCVVIASAPGRAPAGQRRPAVQSPDFVGMESKAF